MAALGPPKPSLLNPFHPSAGIPQPSGYRPFSRSHTTYASMTDWHGKTALPSGLPPTLTDANWKHYNTMAMSRPIKDVPGQVNHSNSVPMPDRPFTIGGPKPTDDFERAFLELQQNIAYRFPNPGLPRERHGRNGSSWRNIKEVLGYGGGQICFVDGLVRQYDTDRFTEYLATGGRVSKMLPVPPAARNQTPAYALNRHNVSSWRRDLKTELEKKAYKPWYKEASHITERQMPQLYNAKPPSRLTRTAPSSPEKYKGSYRLK